MSDSDEEAEDKTKSYYLREKENTKKKSEYKVPQIDLSLFKRTS